MTQSMSPPDPATQEACGRNWRRHLATAVKEANKQNTLFGSSCAKQRLTTKGFTLLALGSVALRATSHAREELVLFGVLAGILGLAGLGGLALTFLGCAAVTILVGSLKLRSLKSRSLDGTARLRWTGGTGAHEQMRMRSPGAAK